MNLVNFVNDYLPYHQACLDIIFWTFGFLTFLIVLIILSVLAVYDSASVNKFAGFSTVFIFAIVLILGFMSLSSSNEISSYLHPKTETVEISGTAQITKDSQGIASLNTVDPNYSDPNSKAHHFSVKVNGKDYTEKLPGGNPVGQLKDVKFSGQTAKVGDVVEFKFKQTISGNTADQHHKPNAVQVTKVIKSA